MSTGGGAHFDVLSGRMQIDVSRIQPTLASVAPAIQNFAQQSSQKFSLVQTAIARVGESVQRMTQNAQKAFSTLQAGAGNVGKAMAGLALAAGGAGTALINLASDANEAASKFGFVFGKATEETGKRLDEFAKAAGRSRYAMRDMAANIGALIGPMGFTKEKTGELSTAFSKLAVDLSSFFNVTEEDALMALKSGIVGESEPLRKFGVQLNEAKIQQEAFNLGLAKNKAEVQGAVKAQAILSIVLRETKQAQGDAIRTGDQFANSLRRMKDFAKDAATDLGQTLIPAATRVVRAIGDFAEPIKNWAKANQQVMAQKVDVYLERLMGMGGRLVNAWKSAYAATQRLAVSFGGLGDKASGVYAKAKKIWDSMPTWAKDTLLVVGSLTAASRGLEAFGSRIPFVGDLAGSLFKVVNPLTLIKGLIAFIGPALGVVFSPAGAAIAVVVAAVYGLYKAFQKAYAESEEFRLQWERVKDNLGEIWAKIKDAAGNAMDWVGEKISDLSGGAFKNLGDVGKAVAEDLLDAFERLLDFFNGDGSGLMSLGMSFEKSWNTALSNVLISIAEFIEGLEEEVAGNPFVAGMLAGAGISVPGAKNTAKFLRNAATGLGVRNFYLDQQQKKIESERAAEQEGRNQQIKDKKFRQKLGEMPGGNEAYEQIFGKDFGAQMAQGQIEYNRTHASEVAQANAAVNQAEAGQYNVALGGQKAESAPSFVIGAGTTRGNMKLVATNAKGMQVSAKGNREQTAIAGQVTQFGQAVAQLYANFSNLTSEQQGAALQLHDTYQKLVDQFKMGMLTQEQFNEQVKAAADNAEKLANAEKELTEEEVAKLNAQGIFTPQQQQQMQQQAQQAMQQFQQQAQQNLQQIGQQLQDLGKQGNDAQQQAAGQMDQQLQAALASNDPRQVMAALSALKGYANAQIQQTLLNAHQLSNEPMAGGGFGGFPGVDNSAYFLTLDSQLRSTLEMFQNTVAEIDAAMKKMPHMATGGIVNSPTVAMIGEAGPEAVIPLPILQRLFGNPANIFPGAGGNPNHFGINPGGFGINPLGLTQGNLGLFDRLFGNASRFLNWQTMLGNGGALGLLANWSKAQQTAEDALGFMYQHRRINLRPGGSRGDLYGDMANGILGRAINPRATGYTENQAHQFNLTMHVDQALRQEHISQVFDWFEAEARRRGADGIGRSQLRSRPSNQVSRGPLTPAGANR